ncbi:mrr restriction system protein [Candidatus Magnetoovum chiemensis]|nr:mrr restriction system protein [Candidatus Magnetoovum chiemensis]
MADPTPYNIALWIINECRNKDYESTKNIINSVLASKLTKKSAEEIAEITEDTNSKVIEVLRNICADDREDGRKPRFEITDESNGDVYIRFFETTNLTLLEELINGDPKIFEKFCAILCKKMGAKESRRIETKYDSGVDFIGFSVSLGNSLPCPSNSRTIILGQAKKYSKDRITLSDVQKFIGGALKETNEQRKKYGVLTPALYAFWTTSEFNKDAKEYCKNMGIWYLDGYALTELANSLGIDCLDNDDVKTLFDEIK